MRILAIVHQPDAGPGVFAEEIAARGDRLQTWAISEDADPPADPRDFDAVLTFGGAMDTYQEDLHPWLRAEKQLLADLLEREVPLMGVCLGAQLVAEAAGAQPRRAREPEIGWREVKVTPEGADDPLLAPLAPSFTAFQWHSFEAPLPPGATPLARNELCLQAYRIGGSAWGIQFHAEVSSADLEHWITNYDEDPDAVRIGLDSERLLKKSQAEIADWNQLGRGLCGRFLDAASR